jgi:manganese-dependent inorganic pyrophosphatase
MNEVVYVFGHQNPDTDSICASIAYAHLKNQLRSPNSYVPVALKRANKEAQYILDLFQITHPKVVNSIKSRVWDIELGNNHYVKEDTSIHETLEMITKQSGRSISVVDQYERLVGVVSISELVPKLLNHGHKGSLREAKTPVKNLIKQFCLRPLDAQNCFKNVDELIQGNLYLLNDLKAIQDEIELTSKDIVICQHNEWTGIAFQSGWIIIGSVDSPEKEQKILQEYEAYRLSAKGPLPYVYVTTASIFKIIIGLSLATPISQSVIKEGVEYFTTYETIDDVRDNMLTSKYRRFPVVDENGMIKGAISRSDLANVNKKKVILVDHNERGQSIQGIEDLEILEIIDHHRVADVLTISPLYFRVEPVGCTCTIVAKMYEENEITIPKEMAALMLSAIISDTLLFNSPTCTETDKEVAQRLAVISELDPKIYGMKMIAMGSMLSDESPSQVLNQDRKKFMFGQYKVTIAQMNTGDFDGFFKIFIKTVEEMERICKDDGFDLFVLLVTDVVVGGTEIIAVGEAKWIVDNAFGMESFEQSRFLPGVFSRKKQIVPKLMNAAHS